MFGVPDRLAWYLLGSFGIALCLCAVLVRLGRAGLMLDQPNARSLHAVPTPRTGGVAIAAGVLPFALFLFPVADAGLRAIVVGWALVFAVSLLDDVRDLRASVRLAVHVIAGLVVILAPEHFHWLSAALGLFWIVWGTNLFNFMDGMDGLAGSMALIGGAGLSAALFLTGATAEGALLAAAVAATGAFLLFNLPPARLFMGDAGSASLGFLFAASGVSGVNGGNIPAWLPLLVFLPFIADATFTLLRRAWRREPVWRAHREHAYQTLVLSGWPVRHVLAGFSTLMLCSSGAALLALQFPDAGWLLTGAAALLTAALYWSIMTFSQQRDCRDKKDLGGKS